MKKHCNIMIQGTGSSVGKTLIVAGLCRIFAQDGYRVSPFKSQNMALNSFVDIEGLEMSRGTVVQAEAGYEIPRAFMNPILLKPNSDNNSQVIINGKVAFTADAKNYFSHSAELKQKAFESYRKYIEPNFDIAVLEGGGSPAEINLREYDLVNMGMAELVDAPVILVGNIDIGGVFASIYGTVMLLDENDRKRIKGYIINKFRGDADLLKPAIDILEKKFLKEGLDIKCLGVIPYADLKIEEEDSLSDQDRKIYSADKKYINIGVIKTKKMSNFTDFYAFKQYDDVRVKYIYEAKDLEDNDVIIFPGSKNTITDLEDLKKRKIFDKVVELKEKGKIIVGICGGLQMLGKKIFDPKQLESEILETDGFNFFNYETTFDEIKKTEQVTKKLENLSGILKNFNAYEVTGYEIHQGVSTFNEPVICNENVFATYIHGIFDNSKFTNDFLNMIRLKKSMPLKDVEISFSEFKENEFNKLADLLRKNLDIEKIYSLICPSPLITYFVVVNSLIPIGPRACNFCVEIPISPPNPNSPPSENLVDAFK